MDGRQLLFGFLVFGCQLSVTLVAAKEPGEQHKWHPSNCFTVPSDRHVRAGYPQQVSPLANHPRCGPYDGYFVGGSTHKTHKTTGPYLPQDGSWGWDYFGHLYQRRVALNWMHDPVKPEPGTYKSDGPKLFHKE